MSLSPSTIDAGQAYELLGSYLRIEHEHLKLALVAQAAPAHSDRPSGSGSTSPTPAPRIVALVSNIDGGVEQAALLLLRRSKRRLDTLRCITAVPLLKGFSGETLTEEAEQSSALAKFKVSCGGERFDALTEDRQGLDDLLKVSEQLAKLSGEHQASGSSSAASHTWVNAYLRRPLRAAGAPIFSRFTSSSFAPSSPPADDSVNRTANGVTSEVEVPRPSSPGPEELSVAIGTFNVNEQPPSELGDLSRWLRPFSSAPAQGGSHHAHSHAHLDGLDASGRLPPSLEGLEPDVLAISLQETQGGRAYLYHGSEVILAWKDAIEKAMGPRRAEYTLLANRQLVGIILLIWVRLPLVSQISSLSTTSVGTGLGGFMANKGACVARFKLGGKTYCFVASHLSAYDGPEARERRRWDFGEVLRRARLVEEGDGTTGDVDVKAALDSSEASFDAAERAAQIEERSAMPEDLQASIDPAQGQLGQEGAPLAPEAQRRLSPPPSASILDADVVFWAGDLNFRLVLPSGSEIKRLLARKQYRALLEFDELRLDMLDGKGEGEESAVVKQLKREEAQAVRDDDDEEEPEDERMHAQWLRRGAGQYERAFKGFKEAPIEFPCTYKYVRGQNAFDNKRNPAWTDRILWLEPQAASSNGEKGATTATTAIRCTSYAASMVDEVGILSDHRPVCATFSVAIEPGSVRWSDDEGLEGVVQAVGAGTAGGEDQKSSEVDR